MSFGDNSARKPLQRKTPLKQGTPLKRSGPLKSSSTLKSTNGLNGWKKETLGSSLQSSGLKSSTPLERKPFEQKPLERTALQRKPLARKPIDRDATAAKPAPRKPIKQVSEKRAARATERRKVANAIKAIQHECVVPGCYQPSSDAHERKTRGRGGSIYNPYNVVGLCRPHHDEITNEAPWAYTHGLLLHGWDPEPETPLELLTPMQKAAVEEMVATGWRPTNPYDVELWWQRQALPPAAA